MLLLLGETLRIEPAQGAVPGVGLLRGTGSTLTSYIYDNSPAGEGGGAAEGLRGGVRAADCFVLLLNFVVHGSAARGQARATSARSSEARSLDRAGGFTKSPRNALILSDLMVKVQSIEKVSDES